MTDLRESAPPAPTSPNRASTTFDLGQKYTAENGTVLLTGVQALGG